MTISKVTTVTTDRLREIISASDGMLNRGEASAIAAELLAAREVQSVPVSFDALADAVKEVTGGIRLEFNENIYKGHHAVPFMNFNSLSRIVEMFRTAPPAPAVIDERLEFEYYMENRFRDSVNRSRAMNGDSEYFAWDMQVAWRVWQGRAAMLQPVSQGYTLNSPVIPDGWKLVPNEPTTKQWAAGHRAMEGGVDKVTLAYRAMIAEAPKPYGEDL